MALMADADGSSPMFLTCCAASQVALTTPARLAAAVAQDSLTGLALGLAVRPRLAAAAALGTSTYSISTSTASPNVTVLPSITMGTRYILAVASSFTISSGGTMVSAVM